MSNTTDCEWIDEIIRLCGTNLRYVVDAGANIGRVAKLLSANFSGAEVLCFEPSFSSFKVLETNFKEDPLVTCFQLALGAYTGDATLHTYTDHLCNTLVSNVQESWLSSTGTETVGVTTLDNVSDIRQIGRIDILKIDVEGYELNVLKGAEKLLAGQRVRFIYAEVGFHRNGRHQYFPELFNYVEQFGYDLCGFYESYKVGNKKQYTLFCNALFSVKRRMREVE